MKTKTTLLAFFVASVFATAAFAAEAASESKKANCCVKAEAKGEACAHDCCIAAAKEGKNCTKCGGAGEIAKKK